MPKVDAWSYSRYTVYKQCPLLYKFKFIDKYPEPSSEALEKGKRVHQDAEDYLKGKHEHVPPMLRLLEPEFEELKSLQPHAEDALGIREDWSETGFFAPDVWCRLKIDAYYAPCEGRLKMIDFKTGKMRDGYQEQLELYATIGFSIFDTIEIQTELWYTDAGKILGPGKPDFTFHIEDFPKLKALWNKRVAPMFADTEFAPTPNDKCRWCYFRKANNGGCEFG